VYKNIVITNNPIHKSKRLSLLYQEIDQIQFDEEFTHYSELCNYCLSNKPIEKTNASAELLSLYIYNISCVQTIEAKESFLLLSKFGLFLSTLQITRHTLEVWGATYYVENCIRQLFQKNSKKEEIELDKKIKKLISGSRLSMEILERFKIDESKLQKSINIKTMIEHLGKGKENQAVNVYDILSESCHPNFGFTIHPIGLITDFNFNSDVLSPDYEKFLIFQFELQKNCLIGVKESLNNILEIYEKNGFEL
jgi:hypothetical protein